MNFAPASALPPPFGGVGGGSLLNCEADGLACILDRRHGDGEGVGRLAEHHFMAAAQQADPLDALAVHLGRLAAERLHTDGLSRGEAQHEGIEGAVLLSVAYVLVAQRLLQLLVVAERAGIGGIHGSFAIDFPGARAEDALAVDVEPGLEVLEEGALFLPLLLRGLGYSSRNRSSRGA